MKGTLGVEIAMTPEGEKISPAFFKLVKRMSRGPSSWLEMGPPVKDCQIHRSLSTYCSFGFSALVCQSWMCLGGSKFLICNMSKNIFIVIKQKYADRGGEA